MAGLDEAAVLSRAKALAAQDGFAWELDWTLPSDQRTPLKGRHFLSEDRREEYLERARAELHKATADA
jgi:hypothetical protein